MDLLSITCIEGRVQKRHVGQAKFESTPRETVHLGIREGHDVVYVERSRPRSTSLPSRIGRRLRSPAPGRQALLAFSEAELNDEILARPLPS